MSETNQNQSGGQTAHRPSMPAARSTLLDRVIENTSSFDADAWHVIEKRDNRLIEDELLNGSGSSLFAYSFDIKGTKVTGLSVIGARHVASLYGGLEHRFVTSTQKSGGMIQHKSYPNEFGPGGLKIEYHSQLEQEDDYYECVVEIKDVKTGVKIQVEKREKRYESKKDGGSWERPHYQIIAQSKAFRNGVLSVIPQDVLIKLKARTLALGKNETITDSIIDEKRDGVIAYMTKLGIKYDRDAVDRLTMDQLSAWQDANKTEAGFVQVGVSLGVISDPTAEAKPSGKAPAPAGDKKAATSAQKAPAKDAAKESPKTTAAGPDPNAEPDFQHDGDPRPEPPHDPETGEITKTGSAPTLEPSASAKPTSTGKTLF